MFRIFDYIYYRLFKQYSKQKWNSNPCSSASIFLCAFQTLVLYCIFMFFRPLLVSDPATLRGKLLGISIAVVMVSLYLFNYHRYKNRDKEIKAKYKKGKRVYHDDYGYGIITRTAETDDGEYSITVTFENSGSKSFLPKYQSSSLLVTDE